MTRGIDHDRRRFLGTVAMTIAAAHLGKLGTVDAKDGGPLELAAVGSAAEWLNSPRLTPSSLAGRVVRVDFWTYTCINWLRTLPYRRAWAQKYRQGLVVIGVHTPEFGFEKNVDSVRRAVGQMRVEYPVVIDNDYAIWRAFKNQYWPALYFIDARGRVREHHFGEGEYDRSEMIIQRLLAEAGAGGPRDGVVSVEASGVEVAADWDSLRSPENYVGYDRTENFASPGGAELDRRRRYAAPARLALNQWALTGEWTMARRQPSSAALPAGSVSLSGARPPSRHGSAATGEPRTVPGIDRRAGPGSGARHRRGRRRQRDGGRAAVVSADPAAETDRRATVRDRVPRCRGGGVRVHVRLTRRSAALPPRQARERVVEVDGRVHRLDPVAPLIARFCGLARIPTARTVGNWLRQFTQATLGPLVQLNHDLVIDAVRRLALPRLTIDIDGTVVRTGATVGWAFRGFNPVTGGASPEGLDMGRLSGATLNTRCLPDRP